MPQRKSWCSCTKKKEWTLTMKMQKEKKSSTSIMMNKTIISKDRNRLFKNRKGFDVYMLRIS